jgi:hypothetical protein
LFSLPRKENTTKREFDGLKQKELTKSIFLFKIPLFKEIINEIHDCCNIKTIRNYLTVIVKDNPTPSLPSCIFFLLS